ncbi:tetratricopeptide repeat protein [Okeania sp. SIO1I7]|uniref:tetratricopeptide repeat protein n=1 Tax=Okeania sp. SIO1I7 TaxID=2607772 RepID=UPI0025E4831F|nr:tetratricopeptide repeat protein [Okeania sp. SIO1I7]
MAGSLIVANSLKNVLVNIEEKTENVIEKKTEFEEYTEIQNENEKLGFNDFYQKGLKEYEQQNYQLALAEFNHAIEMDKGHSDAYIYRGDVKEKLEDYQGAIDDYNQAIKLDATHPKAYYRRGNVLRKVGDNWGAIADYNQAIRLNPNYTSAKHRNYVRLDTGTTEKFMQE